MKSSNENTDIQQPFLDNSLQNNGTIATREAIKDIMSMAAGTIPLQIIKAAIPLSNAILLSRYNETVRRTALVVQTLIDFTSNVSNSPLNLLNTFVGNKNNPTTKSQVGATAQAGWALAILLSIPQIIILSLSKQILKGIGESTEISSTAADFFYRYLISIPFISLLVASNQIALGLKKPHFAVATQTIGMLSFGALIYPLIYGAGIIPEQGIKGSGYSFIANAFSAAAASFLGFLFLSRPGRSLHGFKLFNRNYDNIAKLWQQVKSMAKVAWQIFLITASELGVLTLTNMLVVGKNENDSTAQLMISQYQDINLIIISAFGSAAQSLIANCIETKSKNIMRYGNLSIVLSIFLPLIYMLMTLTCPKVLMGPYIDTSDVDNQYTITTLAHDKLLFISAINSLLMAIRYVSTFSLFGAGEFNRALVLNMLTTWIGVGLGVGLAYGVGINSILSLNLGLTVGFFISATGQTLNWLTKSRRIVKSKKRAASRSQSITEASLFKKNTYDDSVDVDENIKKCSCPIF